MRRRIGLILGVAVAMAGIVGPGPTAAQDEAKDIAIVMLLGQGDFYELWQAGAQSEADRLGVNATVYNAQADSARQASDLEAAINSEPDAILISHGFPETLDPGITEALDKGIPVVSNAVTPSDPRAVQMWIQDEDMAQQVIDVLLADTGGKGDVIYVYVPGYAPLDRRNVIWEQAKAANPDLHEVATIGVVDNNTAAGVADQAKAALQANPDTVAIFAPYDEFAKGATLAVQELGLQDQVKVYGGDISTADIEVMTAEDSPWVATSSVDPYNFGAVAFRTAYTLANGGEIEDKVFVPPSLITQAGLRENGITNMEGLREAFPELVTDEIVPVD
jgi:simple sugar transport system substrate-binding protein